MKPKYYGNLIQLKIHANENLNELNQSSHEAKRPKHQVMIFLS